MLKFYALCSRNLHCVKRHLNTIPCEDLVVVLNSLNKDFIEQASAYCLEHNIEHHITECDGTAATGKNSVLDLIARDADYAVMIDGDDIITPHGVHLYKAIAQMETPPDAVSIQFQMALITDFHDNSEIKKHKVRSTAQYDDPDADPETLPTIATRNYYLDNLTLRRAMAGYGMDNNTARHQKEPLSRQVKFATKYISKNEVHLRMTFVSRKVAQMFRFNKHYRVGEDTDFYIQVKANHFTTGDVVLKHLYDFYPSYIYDFRVAGLCSQVIAEDTANATNWMAILADRYQEYINQNLAFSDMPGLLCVVDHNLHDINCAQGEVREDYDIKLPVGYTPDCLGHVEYPAAQSDDNNCLMFDKSAVSTYNRYKKLKFSP